MMKSDNAGVGAPVTSAEDTSEMHIWRLQQLSTKRRSQGCARFTADQARTHHNAQNKQLFCHYSPVEPLLFFTFLKSQAGKISSFGLWSRFEFMFLYFPEGCLPQ